MKSSYVNELSKNKEKGSLALEQVLFIGAILVMSVGLFAFYDDLSQFFTNVDLSSLSSTPDATGT